MSISPERRQINDRFKRVFLQLQEQGIINIPKPKGQKTNPKNKSDKKGLTFTTIAKELFGGKSVGHIINLYLRDERIIKHEEAKIFCSLFNINTEFMLEGEGEPFQNQQVGNSDLAPAINYRNQILYTTAQAFASSAEEMQTKNDCEYFQIPGLQGEFIAFSVSGNSMQPTLQDGDIIICRELHNGDTLKDNDIYTICANNAIMVKRVQQIWDKSRRQVLKLKLISDNYLEHDPRFLDKQEVSKVWKVERKITTL